MDRRSFLRLGSAAVGSAALAPLLSACSGDDRDRTAESALSVPGLLDGAASDAPIDTVVIVMLENRSFDHHLGWLGDDSAYIAAGRRAYGHGFNITAKQVQQYRETRRQARVDLSPSLDRWTGGWIPRVRLPHSRARMGHRPGPARQRVPRARHAQRHVRDRLLRRHRRRVLRVACTALHRGRPSLLVVDGANVSESPIPPLRHIAGRQVGPEAHGRGHVLPRNDLGPAPSRERERALLLRGHTVAGAVGQSSLRPHLADQRLFRRRRRGNAAERRDGGSCVPRPRPRRRPSPRRHPNRPAVRAVSVRCPRELAAVVAICIRPHLRRVGRLLRPCRAARRS